MSMTHKLLALVTVCLTVVNNRKISFLYRSLWVFGVSDAPSEPLQDDWCSSSVPSFTFPLKNPKSIAAFLSWRSAISSEHSWLREKRYWFFFFFFRWLPEPRWPYSLKKNLAGISERLHSKDTNFNIRLRRLFLVYKRITTEDNSGSCGYTLLAAFCF